MNCCDIHTGMLSERVTIERRTRSADGYGGYTETWQATPAGTQAVSLKPLSGSEAYRAMRIAPTATYQLLMRFRADGQGNPFYTPADRVVHRGRYYNILNVFDVEMRGQWMSMLLSEGTPS